jgi:hypothetical protein
MQYDYFERVRRVIEILENNKNVCMRDWKLKVYDKEYREQMYKVYRVF